MSPPAFACSEKWRDRPPEISRAADRPPDAAQSRGTARALQGRRRLEPADVPGRPVDDGRRPDTTPEPHRWSDGPRRRLPRAVTDLSGHAPHGQRRETPAPGWESGVWVRIQCRRRARRLGVTALAAVVASIGLVVARRQATPAPGPVRVDAVLEGPARSDGSAPVPAVWRLHFEGAELRVYRNALGVVHRCPGSVGCARSGRGGTLALPVDTAGEYRALVFSGPGAGDGLTLQGDLAASRARGHRVEMSPALVAY